MKWLSRIFGMKTEEKPKEKVVMSLDELSDVVESNINHNIENFVPDLKKFHSQIHSAADRMEGKINALVKATPMEKVDFALLKVAVSHRDETVRKLNSMLREFRKDVSTELNAFIDFHDSCISVMNNVDSKLARNFSVFEGVFKQESSSLISYYKDAYKLLADIGNNLKEKKALLAPLNETLNYIETARNILNSVKDNELSSKNLSSELETLKAKEKFLRKDIEKLLSGEEWKSFENIMKERELSVNNVENVKGEITQVVSSIERALKKYGNLPDAYGKDVIEFYLESPVEAVASDRSQMEFNKVIDSLVTAINEGKVDLGEKKGQKLLERISEIKEGSLLNRLAKRYEELQNRIKKLDAEIEVSNVERTKRSLELELAEVNNIIGKTEGQIERLKNAVDDAHRELSGVKTSIENSAKTALNKEITVDIDKNMRV